jgi:hypothetical protein
VLLLATRKRANDSFARGLFASVVSRCTARKTRAKSRPRHAPAPQPRLLAACCIDLDGSTSISSQVRGFSFVCVLQLGQLLNYSLIIIRFDVEGWEEDIDRAIVLLAESLATVGMLNVLWALYTLATDRVKLAKQV